MEDKKLLNDEELEKVSGGMPELTGGDFAFEVEPGNVLLGDVLPPVGDITKLIPTSEGNITESRDWCCKNGHCFTEYQANRFGNLCPVCNEKIEVTDHSICLPNSISNI